MLKTQGPRLRRLSISFDAWLLWPLGDAGRDPQNHLLVSAIAKFCPLLTYLAVEDLRPPNTAEVSATAIAMCASTAMAPYAWLLLSSLTPTVSWL